MGTTIFSLFFLLSFSMNKLNHGEKIILLRKVIRNIKGKEVICQGKERKNGYKQWEILEAIGQTGTILAKELKPFKNNTPVFVKMKNIKFTSLENSQTNLKRNEDIFFKTKLKSVKRNIGIIEACCYNENEVIYCQGEFWFSYMEDI